MFLSGSVSRTNCEAIEGLGCGDTLLRVENIPFPFFRPPDGCGDATKRVEILYRGIRTKSQGDIIIDQSLENIGIGSAFAPVLTNHFDIGRTMRRLH